MVVCRCRKATQFYCFVHKVPVCGECISFPDHKLCVVKTYSDWVIDGDYDWPPKCSLCEQVLQETDDLTRLGCFHLLHSDCLERHLRSYPPHTAPAGYMCPSCSTPIWPPKLVRDGSSALHSKLKKIIFQSELATTLLGSELSAISSAQQGSAPPAFSSPALAVARTSSSTPAEESASTTSVSVTTLPEADSVKGGQAPSSKEVMLMHQSGSLSEAEASSSTGQNGSVLGSVSAAPHFPKVGLPSTLQNGATVRKNSLRLDILNPSALDYDDEDGSRRKYSRRGPLHHQVLRSLVPFWSSSLPTLPVTTPSYRDKRDAPAAEDIIDGRPRRKQRNTAAIDFRKLLLWVAIMSCMATALLLYYRLVQGFSNGTTAESIQVEEQ